MKNGLAIIGAGDLGWQLVQHIYTMPDAIALGFFLMTSTKVR